MNVLILNVNIGKSWGWGGIESHSDTLASLLSRRGHKVSLACWAEGSVALDEGRITLPSRRITIRNSGDVPAIFRLAGILRRQSIDVIIANAGREYWPAAVAALLTGRKTIFIRHQTDPLKGTTVALANRYVHGLVAVSGAVRASLEQRGIRPEKIRIIHNCVSTRRFNPSAVSRDEARLELGIGDEEMVVGTVAKLHRGKGVYEMLSAVAELTDSFPGIKLLFVGDGPEKNGLREETERRSLGDKVIFAGVRRDVERMYAAMDIFVLPSTCEEAFGMVLIEAMSMSRPVIGTTVGGIPDIIRDGVDGLLVPPGDAGAIAAAVRRLISDTALRAKISEEGRRTVEARFSEEVMAEQFDRLLRDVSHKP